MIDFDGFGFRPEGAAINNNGDLVLVSISDENGKFAYNRAKAGDKLRFAHMGYEPTYYTVKEKDLNGQPVNINMKTKSHELLEVEVTANAPHVAFDNPVRSVLDYVIADVSSKIRAVKTGLSG